MNERRVGPFFLGAIAAALSGVGCQGPDTGAAGRDDDGGATWTDPEPGPECGVGFTLDLDIPFNVIGARVVAGRADAETLVVLDDLLDQLRELGGPWTVQVEGPWRGVPGEPFEESERGVILNGSVPDVVLDDGGRLWAYFVDGDLDTMRDAAERGEPLRSGWTGIGGLGAAFSDDGTTWERVDLEISGEDIPLLIVDPDLLKLPDGSWRLYALAIPAEDACADVADPGASPGLHRIWMAESDDLVHWDAVGVAWHAPAGTADPAVWCQSETDCGLVVPHNRMLASARSRDGGLTFEDNYIELPPGPFKMPDLARVGESWWMVAKGDDDILRSMWSDDGWSWTGGGAPGLVTSGPTVVMDGDEALLWVHVKSE